VKKDKPMKSLNSHASRWSSRSIIELTLLAAMSLLISPERLLAQGEERFASPDDAVRALQQAVAARDTNALHLIFGATGHTLVSADVVEATTEREMFAQRLAQKVQITQQSDSRQVLRLGTDGWIFPIPLEKANGQWFFDTEAGQEEILNRRIGANELGAIHVCRAYVEAQREYAAKDRNGDEVLEYAQHLRSTPGTHDGLYWPSRDAEEQSPLGPLVAQARVEGYRHKTRILAEEHSPYHGYYFKILTRQGKHAPGGKYNYIINGHMIGGFGLVAWPAEWGNTAVMTFIVNQQGKVYQKNLGPKCAKLAEALSTYDPDSSWALTEED
jgi:hypothetical protein